MLLVVKYAVLAGLYFVVTSASAQIYTCTAEDGTRVFSDEKCGPDAKIVPGITTNKRSKAGSQTDKPSRVARPAAELEQLLEQCNAGDMKACTQWTHGGGPNHLREQERAAGVACEAGSLAACETRYCADGITEECRQRILQVAKITGDTWYLRTQQPVAQGGVSYQVRCLKEGVREVRDAMIECSGPAGPARCALKGTQDRFARLDQAAVRFCGR
jgi:hypothetical protein